MGSLIITTLQEQVRTNFYPFLALKERQCTLKGQARYENARDSVHWKGVYRVGDRDLGVQSFFNWFLKLTNQK